MSSAIDEGFLAHEKRIWRLRRSTVLLILLTVIYGGYLVIGGAILMKTEGPIEKELKEDLLNLRNEFLKQHPCITEKELEHFIISVVNARDQGIVVTKNFTNTNSKWDLGESVFYATTLITTIGYGHLTPQSTFGKAFSMIYSLVGIPLTLIFLAVYSERLMSPIMKGLRYLTSRLSAIWNPFYIHLTHIGIVGMILVVFFFLIPAAIFYYLEPKWSYFDCVYFCYISLTTIGLGDLVPGESFGHEYHFLYKAGASIYLLIGLTFMVMFLALIAEVPQLNVSIFFVSKGDQITDDPETMRLPLHSSESITRYLSDSQNPVKPTMVLNQYNTYQGNIFKP